MLFVGVDIVEVARVERMARRFGERFLARVYTEAERAHCRGEAQHLAARWAAKEAIAKALGTGVAGFRWTDLEVVVDAADLEDFLATQAELLIPAAAGGFVVAGFPFGAELAFVPAFLDVAEQFDTEFVRVEAAGVGGHRAGVVVGIIDEFGGFQDPGA